MKAAKFILEKGFYVSSALALVVLFLVLGMYVKVQKDLPQLPGNLKTIYLKPPTEIYSSDGILLKVLGERLIVDLGMISPHHQKAVLSVEDARFYQHKGVDPISLGRAFLSNIKAGKIVQGGSTLTQQLSKNLFFSFDKTWLRKFKEMLMAFQMEVTFSKKEILQAYCNQVYFGNGVYGVEEASRLYFGKRASDLTLLEAAMLAGIPNSPNAFNPFRNYNRAIRRSKWVLSRMRKEKMITESQKMEALQSPIVLEERKKDRSPDQYFTDFVLSQMEKQYGREFVYFGGLKIFTTLDTLSQRNAEKAAHRNLKFLERRMARSENKEPLEVALVSLENKTGAVRVLLGGRNHSHSQFNRALSNNRMPGSSFKPIIYMSAMQNLGYHPATAIVDEPVRLNIPGGPPWIPKNYNEKYFGPIVLKSALAKSLNIISVKLMHRLTPGKVVDTARRFGIESPLEKNYSLALGTSGVSPLELASSYSVIANLGIYKKPFFIEKIESYDGRILYKHWTHKVQRFSPQEVYPLLDMMQGAVENGSGRVIRKMGFDHPAAGKTGTTNDFKDGWFAGFVKEFTTSVWVGFDNNDSMIGPGDKGITGSQAAAPIWALFMKALMQGREKSDFTIPPGIRFEKVDVETGFLAGNESEHTILVAVPDDQELEYPPEDLLNSGIGEPAVTVNQEFQAVTVAEHTQTPVHQIGEPEQELMNTHGTSNPDIEFIPIENQIWFMLNLKNASLDQVKNIPVSWYLNILQKSKESASGDKDRLRQGRKNVIDHLIRRFGSIDEEIKDGWKLRDVMTPLEINTHDGREEQ